jgi:23S rRNA pseudouridine2605 synthase
MEDKNQSEKLQKVLARAGMGSRRELEEWISAGRVKVNGQIATLGDRVTAADRITVDGKKLAAPSGKTGHSILLYNKPLGEICTRNDPEGRPTVFDHLPKLQHARWVTVGRLDINTTGLLLFTTDGELANKLMHPSTQIEREYAVRVMGEVTDEMLRKLTRGVELEDGIARFDGISDGGGEGANHWYHVVIQEGRNREVRRLWESQGVKVSRLKRVRYGNIQIPSYVRAGKFVELPAANAKALYELAGLRWQPTQMPLEMRGRHAAKRKGDKAVAPPRETRSKERRAGAEDRPAPAGRARSAPRHAGAGKPAAARRGAARPAGKPRPSRPRSD